MEKVTKFNGTVECPECKQVTAAPDGGRSQLATLPTCKSPPDPHKAAAADPGKSVDGVVDECDSCPAESSRPAESYCQTCDDKLCSEHVEEHRVSRKKKDHVLTPLSGKGTESRCPLHSRKVLTRYCLHCCELACELCIDDGAHRDHSDCLAPLEQAAEHVKKVLRENEETGTEPCHATIERYLKQVNDSIADLQVQSKTISDQVTAEFQKKLGALEKRRGSLLNEVAQILARKQEELEKQAKRLTSCVLASEDIQSMPGLCINDSDLLRLSPSLKSATEALQRDAKKDKKPCVECSVVFSPAKCVSLDEIDQMGVVYDSTDVDGEKSSVSGPEEASIQSDYVVTVILKNRSGADLDPCSPIYSGLTVTLCRNEGGDLVSPTASQAKLPASPEGTAGDPEPAAAAAQAKQIQAQAPLAVPQRRDGEPTQWICRPEMFGSYVVTVMCGSVKISGSPLHFTVPQPPLQPIAPYDSRYSDRYLKLEDQGLTVMSQDNVMRSAYTAPLTSGRYYMKVMFTSDRKIREGDRFPAIGIVPKMFTSTRGNFEADGQFTGLSAGKGIVTGTARVESSAQSSAQCVTWSSVSSITILLDCDAQKLTMTCCMEDGGYSVTWSGIPEGVRIRAGVFSKGTQFNVQPTDFQTSTILAL